ncbi:MAG: DNA mismatch repair protein MutS [Marinifilaceae bacterium]
MAKKNEDGTTPLMKQYYEMKERYPDAILLYRMGDFYETFGEDAVVASRVLGITLTKRSHGSPGDVELAGFPHHALETYMPKLVRAGYRVAICEQLEDPKKTKKLVKRGVIELITPGVSYNDYTGDGRSNSFLAAVSLLKEEAGVSFLDLSTGEFMTCQCPISVADKLLNGFQPKEVIFARGDEEVFRSHFGNRYYLYPIERWFFAPDSGQERLLRHFGTQTLKGFGIEGQHLAIGASGAILSYLEQTKHDLVSHITSISRIDQGERMLLDRFTMRNLELLQSTYEGGASLVDVLDKTATPMGARNLRRWIAMPLKSPEKISERHDVVEALVAKEDIRDVMTDLLARIGDLERLASKVGFLRAAPRELNMLKQALDTIPAIKDVISHAGCCAMTAMAASLDPMEALSEEIGKTLAPDAPIQLVKGGVIAPGIHEELDDLRNISQHGQELLLKMQQREIENTGIPSLKIGYNNVFGYFIEVTKTHKDKAPLEWIRKQTLVNAERYITPELKEYEDKILGAKERILTIESELFHNLLAKASAAIQRLQQNSQVLAMLDTLLSFANCAVVYGYHRPVVDESRKLEIKEGRHPVIERFLPVGEPYISNNVTLNTDSQQIIIITGPNMAGKSALLRQTALIVIMAQAGSFVPAQSAEIGYCDKVFTRVGASDNISQGESTFMVEMNEAAAILNNISDRTLVLFDELGRGTSTYDGISIAWAIVEYLHEHPRSKAKTLFATHYHELNEMAKQYKRIKNYNVSVKEVNNRVLFLRKLVKGGTNHSFGIQVGKMAGLPLSVTNRATEILKQMESGENTAGVIEKHVEKLATERQGVQLSLFALEDPILIQIREELAKMEINALTPLEALNKLNELKKLCGA